MLPRLPPGFVPYPVDLRITLGEFERAIGSEPAEVAAFHVSGSLVLPPRRGKSDEVEFHDSEAELLVRSVVTHNHPTAFPFSPGDAEFAALRRVAELRAVCADGTVYSISPTNGGWPPSDKMSVAALAAVFAIREVQVQLRLRGEPTPTEEELIKAAFDAQRLAFLPLGARLKRTNVWENL